MSSLDYLQEQLKDPTTYFAMVGQQLRNKGLKWMDLAREAEVDIAQISRWKNGVVRPSLESLARVDAAVTRLLYG